MSKPWKKRKELDEHRYWNHPDEQDKHFFKVMIGDFHEKMVIPDRFVQHFRWQTGRTIKLASRHGYTFDVQITKNLEKLVLDSGWKAFARAHDLRTGDFLVFKYDGHSQLKVLIFGPSGCEKIQACNLKKNAAPGKEWWGNTAGFVNTCHDLPMKFPHSGRQIRPSKDTSRQGNDIINVSSSSSASDSAGGISSSEDDHSLPGCILANGTLLNLNEVQKKQLKEKLRAINSEIPIYGCVIRKSSIYGATRSLDISRKYAEVYLPFKEQMLTLQRHGKKWEVRCRVKKNKNKRLMRGWKHFARGNNLTLGDACLFELLRNKKKYVMNVHIIHKSLYKRKCTSEGKLAT
ncbi:putative B3 domain-containing protein Os03g0621600 isoform X1 [Triticum dicoccoides]|uniref:putative B3 domain-containing protein Os03g0621600 isoform X1 n=1 Tax=Triticum dicoccoides TaxID=85692 RepID=UPI00188FE4F6|nr:putative B3 domain-containing protein Os03g0621600 isoform X1 [Triticum dicoccoides]